MTVPKLIIFDLDSTLMSDYGELYDNVEKMLREIREKKIKIALASYNVNGENRLKRSGIRQYFDMIICESWNQEDIDYKDKMLQQVLKSMDMEASDVIFFDDNIKNIKTAEKLGVNAIHVVEADNSIYNLCKQTIRLSD